MVFTESPVGKVSNNTIATEIDSSTIRKRRAKRKYVRSRLKAAPSAAATTTALAMVIVVAALSSANHSHAVMAAFIYPSKATLASRGALGDSFFFSALGLGVNAPRRGQRRGDARLLFPSKTRLFRTRGRFFGWSGSAGNSCKSSRAKNSPRFSCAEEGPNGYSELWVTPRDLGEASSRRTQQAELTISSPLFLGKATPDLSFLLGGGEGGSASSDPGAPAVSPSTAAAAAAVEVCQTGREDDKVQLEENGDGNSQEQGRRREDIYKIRSLLLQGQIAGLRDRLKERETDVRELRILTGGRGQSRLRELEAMLKEARSECDALKSRERALAEELALGQKEGDTLRESLLDSQKSLADLNVYTDSLRSRYTAEMSKLEASLSEMERELTRAEAAHSRERRELIDREASAVADGQRFRNRSILLEGEVVKIRARETDLRRENARLLMETSTAATSPVDEGRPFQTDQETEEVAALRRDNAELKLKLDDVHRAGATGSAALVEPSESTIAGGLDGEVESKSNSGNSGTRAMSVESERRSWAKGSGGNVEREARSSSSGIVAGTVPETVVGMIPGAAPETVSRTLLGTFSGKVSGTDTEAVPAVEEGGVIDAVVTTNSGDDREGFASVKEAESSLVEVGLLRVVEGLRAENGRLMKKVKATEAQARDEAARADRFELELGRVRVTVKERVQALKSTLVEAEQDAQRARVEKEDFVAQWEVDVDALRRQVVDERKSRKDETRELEGIIHEVEDQLNDLKIRYAQLKSDRTVSKRRVKSSPNVLSDTSASKERSSERTEEPSAGDQWNKALSLLEHLD